MHPTTDEIVREALAEDEKAWKSKKKLAAKARSDDDDISDDADEVRGVSYPRLAASCRI